MYMCEMYLLSFLSANNCRCSSELLIKEPHIIFMEMTSTSLYIAKPSGRREVSLLQFAS